MKRCRFKMSFGRFASGMKLKSMNGTSGTEEAKGRAVGPTQFRWGPEPRPLA